MNVWKACPVALFALNAAIAQAAEQGIYTLVDGDARVLRGATWFRLAPGSRVEEGDVIDAAERAQVQFELTRGGVLNIQGPAIVYAAALPPSDAKANLPVEVALQRGWYKVVAAAKARPLRLRLPAATIDIADAVVVLHDNPPATELFVEKGSAQVTLPVARGKEAPPREAKEGEFWGRRGDRPFDREERAPSAFVAAMPRDLREALPSLAGRYTGAAPTLAPLREISFAEAEPWLAGSTRRAFARRLAGRLSDRDFRAAAAAARPIPEWDRILHPEKYRPPPESETPGITESRQ